MLLKAILVGGLTVALISWGTNDDPVPSPVIPIDNLPAKIEIDGVPNGLVSRPKSPDQNPLTAAKVQLGRRLFFEPRLSKDDSVACACCHQPEHGFASPDPLAIGIHGKQGRRNSPSLINRGYGMSFSWDGRDQSLEDQVRGPITNEIELASDMETVIKKIGADESYVQQFREAFSDGAATADGATFVTEQNLVFAIASFERTILSGNSPVDRFRSAEYEALSLSARQGMWIFESRGGCWKCHTGSSLSDEKFHNTGVGFGQPGRDEGRFEFSKDPPDKFRYKTPALRDVEHTAPYMHNGSIKTLKEVVEFYNQGGSPDDPGLDQDLQPLKLSPEEVDYLVDFLKALSGA